MERLDAGLGWAEFARRVQNLSPGSLWAALAQRDENEGRTIRDPKRAVRALEALG